MADYRQSHHQHQQQPTEAIKGMLPQRAPSKSQVLVVVTLLPVGGTLLLLSGLILAGTLIGLAITKSLIVILCPVLVPAVLVIAFAMVGFLTSGACGITALSSLSYIANFLRRMRVPEQMEQVKRRGQETVSRGGRRLRRWSRRFRTRPRKLQRKLRTRREGKHELEVVGSTQGLEAN